jgi:hypothetical protein
MKKNFLSYLSLFADIKPIAQKLGLKRLFPSAGWLALGCTYATALTAAILAAGYVIQDASPNRDITPLLLYERGITIAPPAIRQGPLDRLEPRVLLA